MTKRISHVLTKSLVWGIIAISWLCFFLALNTNAEAAGLLTPKGGNQPALAIQDHDVDVVVQDGYAVTTIEQTFHNPHLQDLEAVYAFPVPDKAAVSEFTYWVDGRPVVGEVVEKKEARRIYEEEKAAGRETAVAEQNGYKTFTMNVYPVRAGQDVKVRMSYIQPAKIDTGIGRYVYPLEDGGVDQEQLSFWTAQEEVKGRFSFDLTLRSSAPAEAVRLPSHPHAVITQTPSGDWRVQMDNGAGFASSASEDDETPGAAGQGAQTAFAAPAMKLDTDIVVYWRLKAGLPGSVDVTPYKEAGSKTGTFMMTVTPGDDLKPITEGRDWVFILDKSGSMGGKWAALTDGIEKGLQNLGANDRFRIVLFDDHASDLTRGYRAVHQAEIDKAIDTLSHIQPDNSTNLYAGLELGFKHVDQDRTSGIILVTDGVANTGETRKRAFLDLVDKADVRLFTMIMGNSANRPLLNNIAKASNGTAIAVSNSDDLIGKVMEATSKLKHEAMHDVHITIDGVKTLEVWPQDLGSLYRGQQMVLFGHYRGSGEADVRVTGKVSGRPIAYRTQVKFPDQAVLNLEIERLWAYAAIEDVMWEIDTYGENADRKQAATDLAVEYGLVTPYTSMIVVREEVFAQHGIDRHNKARVEAEQQARQQRAGVSPSASTHVLSGSGFASQPQGSLSGGSGAGALDVWALLPVLALGGLLFAMRRKASAGAA